ncbi:alpha/beta hydrolase family protein [Mycobacterium kyogaense]|uniref:alpha/beta hydrolase family protein n=1 Tax=Mycobacterium kyogaense TaxID=2212479 RepID=UPI002FFAD9AD
MTRTTDLVAHWRGATPFLPKLFVLRYANMGGLDPQEFAGQIRAARSFRADRWCDHWNRIAALHLRRCDAKLRDLGRRDGFADVPDLDDAGSITDEQIGVLQNIVGPGAVLFADHGPQPSAQAIDALVAALDDSDRSRVVAAFEVIDTWVKALTYFQVSAFPGHDPHRMAAYRRSRDLFDVLVRVLAPSIDVHVEQVDVTASDGQTVRGWLILPSTPGPHPVVLTTNGLEGTIQELAVALLRYRGAGLATFLMEMPGSYAYAEPMSRESEAIYRAVIDRLASDDRLDPGGIAFVGVSFGGVLGGAHGRHRLPPRVRRGVRRPHPPLLPRWFRHARRDHPRAGADPRRHQPDRARPPSARAVHSRSLRRHHDSAVGHQRHSRHAAQHPGHHRPG